jgi:hypothetical protein
LEDIIFEEEKQLKSSRSVVVVQVEQLDLGFEKEEEEGPPTSL